MGLGRLTMRMPSSLSALGVGARSVGLLTARPAAPSLLSGAAPASGRGASPVMPSSGSILPAFRFGASIQVRNSTKHASGTSRNGRKSSGKRLGPKKLGGQKVRASNILFRQRGTKWHAGENVHCGRDHTLNSLAPGYVQYYIGAPERKTNREARAVCRAYRFLNRKKDTPAAALLSPLRMRTIYHTLPRKRSHPVSKHTYRRYIGITLTKDQKLPVLKGQNSPRLLKYERAGVRQTPPDSQAPPEHQKQA